MAGLSRFSNEDILKRMNIEQIEGKSYSFIVRVINRDRSSDRLYTSR